MEATPYIGRFAPSPTGPLHAGSLAAALASWLDAKAHGGQWLVRIEDTDTPRCVPGADMVILQQLAACGLHPDAPPVYQSQRSAVYQGALDQLIAQVQAYPCGCSRQDIERANERATQQASERASVQASERANERATQPVIALAVQQAIALAVQQAMAPAIESADAQANAVLGSPDHCRPRHNELVYPGTCRDGLYGKTARSWRFLTRFNLLNKPVAQQIRARAAPDLGASTICRWTDRWLGAQQQNVSAEVGDFVLKRADGLWAYQLAVVVDDAAQGVTHVVRGADLADNTARQILLQRALGLRQPQYLHTPLVLGANGEKLSKQNGAPALDTTMPVVALQAAALTLGLHLQADSVPECLDTALQAWLAA